jgi:hypothetical protein
MLAVWTAAVGDEALFSVTACEAQPAGGSIGMSNNYQIDTALQLTGTFIDLETGQPADPTVVSLFLLSPNGQTTTLTLAGGQVVREGTGVYTYTFTPSVSGTWTYKWQGTGAVVATSADTTFDVATSELIPG